MQKKKKAASGFRYSSSSCGRPGALRLWCTRSPKEDLSPIPLEFAPSCTTAPEALRLQPPEDLESRVPSAVAEASTVQAA
jgi:hypothetical protein